MGCCCPGGGVPPCRADARPIASPWLPWGDPCGWSCRLFWGVLVSGSGALGCYTPAGTTGAGGGAGGHSSVPVLWWLWLSSSCQQKWKKNCTPRGWFDSSSVPGLPPPGIALTGHSPPGLCGRPRDGDVARTRTRLRDRDAACQAYHGAQPYTSPARSSRPCLFIPGWAIFVLILCFSSAPLHRTWCLSLPWVQMG